MIVKKFTRPKHNFTHPELADGWLGGTLIP